MEDLFFNYLVKIYLSQYRRNGGSAALENFFEKSTQPEVYLSFFGLSVAFLLVTWQLREVLALMCEREVRATCPESTADLIFNCLTSFTSVHIDKLGV